MYKIDQVDKEKKSITIVFKIVSFLICLFMIPILVFNGFLMFKSFQNPNQVPSFFGYKNFVIISRSMEPTIRKRGCNLCKRNKTRRS